MGQATPPAGEFLSVSADENYTCGIRTDHTLSCWGRVPEVLQKPVRRYATLSHGAGTHNHAGHSVFAPPRPAGLGETKNRGAWQQMSGVT